MRFYNRFIRRWTPGATSWGSNTGELIISLVNTCTYTSNAHFLSMYSHVYKMLLCKIYDVIYFLRQHVLLKQRLHVGEVWKSFVIKDLCNNFIWNKYHFLITCFVVSGGMTSHHTVQNSLMKYTFIVLYYPNRSLTILINFESPRKEEVIIPKF